MMLKNVCRLIQGVLLTVAVLLLLTVPASAREERPEDIPTEIFLFAMDETYSQYLTIPDELAQSWSFAGHSVHAIEGSAMTIEADGTVIPCGIWWYYHQMENGFWTGTTEPTGTEGEIAVLEYEYGDGVILVDKKWRVTVHVIDYARHYAEQIMDAYLAENVTDGMTQYQIAERCCQFVAGYDYSTEASGYTSMIAMGGGDCRASVNTLIYMLNKEGILCQSRDASGDPGAGSGHMNVVAMLDGAYYILEAGYQEEAPRSYHIEALQNTTVFTYSTKKVGNDQYEVCITGLIIAEGITEIVIPSEIDGMKVTGIGSNAFSRNEMLVSVVLPDTLRDLGEEAFLRCSSLQSIDLPEGLETIGRNCFTWMDSLTELNIPSTVTEIDGQICVYCKNLTAVNVHEDNAYYSSVDGVMFDKDMQTLLIYPKGKGQADVMSELDVVTLEQSYTIPDGVRTIAGWSFVDVNLGQIHIPDSVNEIQSYAFYNAWVRELTLPEGLEVIESRVFDQCHMYKLTMPGTLKRIEDRALWEARWFEPMIIPEGVEYIGAYAFAGGSKNFVVVPDSVKEIGSYAFHFEMNHFSLGGESTEAYDYGAVFLARNCSPDVIADEAFHTAVLCVHPDSDMHRFAVDNGLPWYPRGSDGTVELKQEWFNGIQPWEYAVYTGEPVEPPYNLSVANEAYPFHMNSRLLALSFSDNIHIGTAAVTITGQNLLSGTAELEFTIWPAKADADVIDRSGCGLQYKVMEDHVEIVDFIAASIPQKLVIPETLEGLPVTVIGYAALKICENLVEVTIPATVQEIKGNAFSQCKNLEKIVFEGSMPTFEKDAFYKIQITCCYPETDASWQQDAMLNYGGKITWQPVGAQVPGDVNGNGTTDADDAIYLLYHILFGGQGYPVSGGWDLNADGALTSDDAVYLLYHTLFGEEMYPLHADPAA